MLGEYTLYTHTHFLPSFIGKSHTIESQGHRGHGGFITFMRGEGCLDLQRESVHTNIDNPHDYDDE